MHITWLGSTALKIQTKPGEQDITIIIDPYKQETGTTPRSLAPNIAIISDTKKETFTLSGEPFIFNSPGEIETKGVLITAALGHDPEKIIIRIDSENMSIAHLGITNKQLTNEQLDIVNGVDILCLPVGGGEGYDADQAVKTVNSIEPRIIIPLGFKSDNEPTAADASTFLKAIGLKADEPEKKVILRKKDLPQEDTQIIVLAKE